MLEDQPEDEHNFLWRFMIDAQYQSTGFGLQAMERLIAHVKTRPGAA